MLILKRYELIVDLVCESEHDTYLTTKLMGLMRGTVDVHLFMI